jgi:hypothetical protein
MRAALRPLPRRERGPLLAERSDFLEGDEPAADKVEAFLDKALAATAADPEGTAHALVPWICDVLLSNHSIKAYGRDFVDFVQHMKAQGVDPLQATTELYFVRKGEDAEMAGTADPDPCPQQAVQLT